MIIEHCVIMEQNENESQQESQVIVALLEFGSSKQQLKLKDCSFATIVAEVEKALGTLGADISVLCAGKSPTGSKDTYSRYGPTGGTHLLT